MKKYVVKNWKNVILSLILLLVYLWDQERRSYVLPPEYGVLISTNCHFVELQDLRLCQNQRIKAKLAQAPETPRFYLGIIYTDTNSATTSSKIELNLFFAKNLYIPQNTNDIYLFYSD